MATFGVLAYHLIMTNYGFWLPNDPRGSWSEFVRSWDLYLAAGPASKTDSRRSVAGSGHDHRQRLAAKESLVRDPVVFSGQQAKSVGDGFSRFVSRSDCSIFAASIMPRHTHLVVGRMPYTIEQVANLLKGAATSELSKKRLHPFANSPHRNGRLPTPWSRHQWACYLSDGSDIARAVRYVEENPVKDGLPKQRWPFVKPFLV